MGLPGRAGKGRGDRDHARATEGEGAEQVREAQVVADRHAKSAPGHGGNDRLAAGGVVGALRIDFAIGERNVEHMDLVVAGGDIAVGRDQVRAVGKFVG